MSPAMAITRRDLTASVLRAVAARSRDARLSRRMPAIALAPEGVDRKSGAETCGMDRQPRGTGCTATTGRGSPGSRTAGAKRGKRHQRPVGLHLRRGLPRARRGGGPRHAFRDTVAMTARLAEIARTVAAYPHAALVLDGACWHAGHAWVVPGNVSLVLLRPYGPDLNPVENVWRYLPANSPAISAFDDHDAIVTAGCYACPRRCSLGILSVGIGWYGPHDGLTVRHRTIRRDAADRCGPCPGGTPSSMRVRSRKTRCEPQACRRASDGSHRP